MTLRTRISIRLSLIAALASAACSSPMGGADQPDGGGGGGELPGKLALPGGAEHVTAFFCPTPGNCLIGTYDDGDPGHLYASDGKTVTTLVTGDSDTAAKVGVVGELGFTGFSKVGDRLIALVEDGASAYINATGDVTKPSSWSVGKLGTTAGDFGLNQQMGFGTANGTSVLFTIGIVYRTSSPPAPNASWDISWSPQRLPPVPENIEELVAADPTLCNTDPGVSSSPKPPQGAYVAPDLSIIVSPSGSLNQYGDDSPGVCISTDGAQRFHHVAFDGLTKGPMGVGCTSKDHCVAYTDKSFNSAGSTAYVFVSNDASKGSASTWTAAKTPELPDDTRLRNVVFAADAKHGWLVGWSDGATPRMYATTDGGATWTDATSALGGAQSFRPYAVMPVDDHHLWVGGQWVGGQDDVLIISM